MVDLTDDNFRDWLDKAQGKDESAYNALSDDEKLILQEKYNSFCVYLKSGENKDYLKADGSKKEYSDLTDDEKDKTKSKNAFLSYEDDFNAYLGKRSAAPKSLTELEALSIDKQKAVYAEYQSARTSLSVSEEHTKEEDSIKEIDPEWRSKKQDSWQKWASNNGYAYREDASATTALKFDLSKGDEKSTIHYNSERDVSLESAEGKTPEFSMFDHLVKEAKSDGIPGITFKEPMTPEFKQKLAIACIKYGVDMEGGPDKIDESLVATLGDKVLESKIKTFNKKKELEAVYKDGKETAQKELEEKGVPGASGTKELVVDISEKIKDTDTPEAAALIYATYANTPGIKIGGQEKLKLNNPCGIIAVNPNMLPKEAAATIQDFNQTRTQETYKTLVKNYKASSPRANLAEVLGEEKKSHGNNPAYESDPYYKAIVFAAYTTAKSRPGHPFKFKDLETVNKDTRGAFMANTSYLPDEAANNIKKSNQDQREALIKDVRAKDPATITDAGEKDLVEKVQKNMDARDILKFVHDKDKDLAVALGKEAKEGNISDSNDAKIDALISGMNPAEIQTFFGDKTALDKGTPEEKREKFKTRYKEATQTMVEQAQSTNQNLRDGSPTLSAQIFNKFRGGRP